MISLHPIIAEAAAKIFRPSPVNCSCLLKGMERYLNGESTEKKNTWGRTHLENQSLEPYVLSFVKAFPQPVPWLASAFDEMVTFLWIQEYFPEAEAYSLDLFAAVESYYGECHQLTGQMALRTAAVYYNEMKFSEAGEWYIKVSRMYRYEKKYEQAMTLAGEALRCARNYQKEFADMGGHPRIVIGFCLLEQSKLLLCRKKLREVECVCLEALREYELVLKHLCRSYPHEERWKERIYKKISEDPLDAGRTVAACRS